MKSLDEFNLIPDKFLVWNQEWKDIYSWEYYAKNFFWCSVCLSYQEGICECQKAKLKSNYYKNSY